MTVESHPTDDGSVRRMGHPPCRGVKIETWGSRFRGVSCDAYSMGSKDKGKPEKKKPAKKQPKPEPGRKRDEFGARG
jgi:hypothetical protein